LKKGWIVLTMVLLLSGCGAEETFETVSDVQALPVMAQPKQISVRLPDNGIVPVLEMDDRQVYLSEEYEIVMETVSSGDLEATVRNLSGYEKDQLTILQTQKEDIDRYEFVWVSTGEVGDRLGRAVILDDGNYHYCMSVLRDAASVETSQIVWSEVFQSFALI